jgi:predicted nucleic acid-binding protein
MTAKVFADTNLLLYTRDTSEPQKQDQAMAWMSHLWSTRTGKLSYQVLQEFCLTVTAKLQPGLDTESARRDVRSLLAWQPIVVNERVLENAWLVQDSYQIFWWDALIVSAAQLADCRYLLTEDLQENQKFGSLRVINPFHVEPASLKSKLVLIQKRLFLDSRDQPSAFSCQPRLRITRGWLNAEN